MTALATPQASTARRVTPTRVLRSEWIKLRTLRSSWLAVAGAAATMLATALVVALSTRNATTVEADMATPEAPLQGYLLAQLVVGVLGVLFVSSEYGTGMVRATFAAVPTRLPVLGAKAVVFGIVALVAMTAAAFASFLGAQAVLAGHEQSASLSDPGVLHAVAGTGAYLALVGLLGGALAWIIRSTAGTIGALTAILLVVPSLALLLPASLQDAARFLPSEAGKALMTSSPGDALLGPWAGLGVLVLWVAGAVVAAAVLLRRRDV